MKKIDAIYYLKGFGSLYCENDVRLGKHRVNVVFGNFIQIFNIDEYFIFTRGRFPQQMDYLSYHKYGIPVLGNFFRPLHFSLLVQFIEFLSINIWFYCFIRYILTASILSPIFVFIGKHCFSWTLIVFPESRQIFGYEFIILKQNFCTVGLP